jgi:hypothetical protein
MVETDRPMKLFAVKKQELKVFGSWLLTGAIRLSVVLIAIVVGAFFVNWLVNLLIG